MESMLYFCNDRRNNGSLVCLQIWGIGLIKFENYGEDDQLM